MFLSNKKLDKIRVDGIVEKMVQYADEVFQRVCEEGKTYP